MGALEEAELTKGRLEEEIAAGGKVLVIDFFFFFFCCCLLGVACFAFLVLIWKCAIRQVEELKNRSRRDVLWVEVAMKQAKIPRRFPQSR